MTYNVFGGTLNLNQA